MMKEFKNIVAVVLACTMLVACGNANGNDQEVGITSNESETNEQAVESADQPETVVESDNPEETAEEPEISEEAQPEVYSFKGISFVIPEEFEIDALRTFDSGAVRADAHKDGERWAILVTYYDPDYEFDKEYKVFDHLDTIYGEAELSNFGFTAIDNKDNYEFIYSEIALIQRGDDIVKIEADHVTDNKQHDWSQENQDDYTGLLADLLPKMLVPGSEGIVTDSETSNYQFKYGNFKYNISEKYEVMYTFADKIDRSRANAFLGRYNDVIVHLYISKTDSIYSICDQKDISSADFKDDNTIINAETYGDLKLYTYSSSFDDISEEFEFVRIESEEIVIFATYRSETNLKVLADLLPDMIHDSGKAGNAYVMDVTDAQIEVDDNNSILIGNTAPGFGMNLPSGWEVGLGSNHSEVGYYGLFLENADGLNGIYAECTGGIGYPITNYFYKGDQLSEERIVSIQYIETLQCKYGEIQVFDFEIQEYYEDFGWIETRNLELGLLNNNGEGICFEASPSKLKPLIEKINNT